MPSVRVCDHPDSGGRHAWRTIDGVGVDVCAACGDERVTPPVTAEQREPEPGRLKWPYPVEHCAADDCQKTLGEHDAAYLYKALFDRGALSVFCDDCARYIEMNFPERFALVAL